MSKLPFYKNKPPSGKAMLPTDACRKSQKLCLFVKMTEKDGDVPIHPNGALVTRFYDNRSIYDKAFWLIAEQHFLDQSLITYYC